MCFLYSYILTEKPYKLKPFCVFYIDFNWSLGKSCLLSLISNATLKSNMQ